MPGSHSPQGYLAWAWPAHPFDSLSALVTGPRLLPGPCPTPFGARSSEEKEEVCLCVRAHVCVCLCVCVRARVSACVCVFVCVRTCVSVSVGKCIWVGDQFYYWSHDRRPIRYNTHHVKGVIPWDGMCFKLN